MDFGAVHNFALPSVGPNAAQCLGACSQRCGDHQVPRAELILGATHTCEPGGDVLWPAAGEKGCLEGPGSQAPGRRIPLLSWRSHSSSRRQQWRRSPQLAAAAPGRRPAAPTNSSAGCDSKHPALVSPGEAARCRAQHYRPFNPADLRLQHKISRFLNSPNRSYVNLTFFLKCLQCLFSPAAGLF